MTDEFYACEHCGMFEGEVTTEFSLKINGKEVWFKSEVFDELMNIMDENESLIKFQSTNERQRCGNCFQITTGIMVHSTENSR